MTYQQTLEWLFSQLPMYQRQGQTAYKKDLGNIKKLVEHLKYPDQKFKSIHVAGTNGKGSVCHSLASIFQEAGYKTGLYTSPHLKDFRERIRINGKMITKEYVVDFIQNNRAFLEREGLSFFEMTVGLAFNSFAEEKVDIAIIETGLGGRLDSTNIINPELSIITNIGWDHTKILGDTLEKIAFEKAGIIKANTPVIIGKKQKETSPVFENKVKQLQANLYYAEDNHLGEYSSDLKGNYQKENRNTVLTAVKTMQEMDWKIPEQAIKKGLQNVQENTGLMGRWQIIQSTAPQIITDTAHNKDGLILVLKQLLEQSYNQLHIVLGVVNDKDLTTILPLFPKEASYYFCRPNVPRGLAEKELQKTAKEYQLEGDSYSSVNQAFNTAKKQAENSDLIFIGGSTFTVAEIL